MDIFITLLLRLIPLYLIIALGFLSVRKMDAKKETISSVLIYLIAPLVFFVGAYQAHLTKGALVLPLVVYIISAFVGGIFLLVGRAAYGRGDSNANLLSLASSIGNTGYFGLPVALLLFGEDVFILAILAFLGDVIYANTLGFYITANGNYTAKESLIKVTHLPAIYAFALGLLFNVLGVRLDSSIMATLDLFKGAYSVLGMMIIGMGLAGVTLRHFDLKFIGLASLGRFVVWPLLALGAIYLDRQYFGLFTENMVKVLILFSIVPIAANTVAFATELKVHPEKAALVVFISTLLALFYIPLFSSLFLY